MSPRRSKYARLSPSDGDSRSCLDVGTVEETDAEHLQRHTGLARRSCPRCLYLVRRSEMERQATSRGGIKWLSQRPSFLGGSWALGCCVCAAARKSEVIVQARRERAARGQHQACARAGCKWARYEVCRSLNTYVGQHGRFVNTATLLQQHAHSKAHVEAIQLLDTSENHLRFAEVVQVDTLTAAGEAAFAGLVPQPTDWKNAWAENSSCVSFHKQQTIADKKGEAQAGSCVRKQRLKMLAVQAEQERTHVWKRLREATSVCLSMDEGKARKVLRVRCDTREPPYSFGGVIGFLDTAYANLEEITEDHGKTAVNKLGDFFRDFFTPLSGAESEAGAFEAFVDKVFVLCADGAAAARKILFMCAVFLFKNLRMVIRDPAHAIRRSLMPMHFDSLFGQVWHEIADRKHALLPDVMNSPKNQQILQALQVTLAVSIPNDARPVQTVLRHLSFAKQRMDSAANPLAALGLMLLVVGTMLAIRASDVRNTEAARKNATHLLKLFKPLFCEAVGASADWGLVTLAFTRLFDSRNHDISCTTRELETFFEVIDACFRRGGIFTFRDAAAATAAAAVAGEGGGDGGETRRGPYSAVSFRRWCGSKSEQRPSSDVAPSKFWYGAKQLLRSDTNFRRGCSSCAIPRRHDSKSNSASTTRQHISGASTFSESRQRLQMVLRHT